MCVLMELAALLHKRRAALELRWLPRLQNAEADQLTNGDYRGFDFQKRVQVDMSPGSWLVMDDMLAAGADLYREVREGRLRRAKRKLAASAGAGRVSTRARLRETAPWGD